MATVAQQTKFIETIAPIIQAEAFARGYQVCSPVIAQACLESAYGTCKLSKHYNYFGLKCGKSWKGKAIDVKTKEEYTVGVISNITAAFRGYDSMASGVAGYFDFINTKRYANLKDAKSAREYLTLIKSDGYATDSKYVDKNMTVVNKFNLEQYDCVSGVERCPYTNYNTTTRKGSKGEQVKWVQWQCNRVLGTTLKCDGVFGAQTEATIKAIQAKFNLKTDGIVGAKTIAVLTE